MKKGFVAGVLAVLLVLGIIALPSQVHEDVRAAGWHKDQRLVDGKAVRCVSDPTKVVEQIARNWDSDSYKGAERATDYEEKFQLQRVILKWNGSLEDSFGAASCIYYEKSGEYILEYESEKETKNAYDKFRQIYGAASVSTDRLIQVSGQDAVKMGDAGSGSQPGSAGGAGNGFQPGGAGGAGNGFQPGGAGGAGSGSQPGGTEVAAGTSEMSDYVSVSNGTSYLGLDKLKTEAMRDSSLGKITVAVLDTGLSQKHELFANRTISEKSRSMITEGGMFLNFSSYRDNNGHGTHVAGVICDGTPEQVELLVVKIMDHNGMGSLYDARMAVDYAVENGASVINCSFGGEGFKRDEEGVPEMEESLRAAVEKGVLTIVASGNGDANGVAENIEEVLCYPAYSDYVVSVGAIGEGEKWMEWSNYGESLDFVAPGEAVRSASIYGSKFYDINEGTSFASPFVAAAAAMVKLYHPDYSADETMEVLVENAVDVEETGKDVYTGYGYIELSSSSETVYQNTPIDYFNLQSTDLDNVDSGNNVQVADVSIRKVTAGSKKFTVIWRKDTGKVSGFQIRYSRKASMKSASKKKVRSSSIRKKTISSLVSGKKYYVQVRAYYTGTDGSVRYGGWSGKKGVRV